MDNKELQELFDAKRTTEANRRRQEELRQRLLSGAAPAGTSRPRRLWPVWAGAIAAGIALLVATVPFLASHRTPLAATETARAEEPQAPAATAEQPARVAPATPHAKPLRRASRHSNTAAPVAAPAATAMPAPEAGQPLSEELAMDAAPTTHTAEESTTSPEAIASPVAIASGDALAEAEPPAPRIHIRTSTRMTSNSTQPAEEKPHIGNFIANLFTPSDNAPLTLKKIDLS